jgi:hypothetical protein
MRTYRIYIGAKSLIYKSDIYVSFIDEGVANLKNAIAVGNEISEIGHSKSEIICATHLFA